MSWIALIIAGFCEVLGVNGMQRIATGKKISGFILLIGGFIASLNLLSFAMTSIPLGVAYAVWTGMGTIGGVVVGMVFYGDPADRKRIFFLSLIVVAVIGLRVVTS
ncbi:multidrug resistance protein SMR [[Bacillus] enclensis]|uniref:Paired small multidrug resistance pump n=1 Tax=[Bacillus] enclensis TaxID=1402860 RepID=A0A0V8HEB7_9BACI|nr:multidrug efflux SMR transporter [[Bacillus] enclensis]KSU60592.1 multidrug resistance protein SMR [[Bacillus] enclensis]SCC26590.1 paired small multidrug resistance pump [[Bacillus] enclensis]